MKLINQVCTLEQAKRLKELGVVQVSQYIWREGQLEHIDSVNSWADQETVKGMLSHYDSIWERSWRDDWQIYSAFTVAELGAVLPGFAHIPLKSDMNDYWYLFLDKYEQFKTEAEARAALLIYRLEKGAITVAEVNHFLKAA